MSNIQHVRLFLDFPKLQHTALRGGPLLMCLLSTDVNAVVWHCDACRLRTNGVTNGVTNGSLQVIGTMLTNGSLQVGPMGA